MRTQQKKGQSVYLQKRDNRWKWMAGATAATAAGVTASHASAITINLVNNYISAVGGNHLNADLTGDGHPDLTIANVYVEYNYHVFVTLNGVRASAFYDATNNYLAGFERLGGRIAYFHTYYGNRYGTASLIGSIPIFFKDLHINGGAPTSGSLEVTASGIRAEVRLDSLTYISNTAVQTSRVAVPDQGSSLALLAIGAGGILALRRWRAAKGPS